MLTTSEDHTQEDGKPARISESGVGEKLMYDMLSILKEVNLKGPVSLADSDNTATAGLSEMMGLSGI